MRTFPRLTLLSLIGSGFAALLPWQAPAAEAFEDSVPRSTVEVMLGLTNDPDAALYRDIAEGFPLPGLAEGLQVLGSVVQTGQITLHLRSDDTGDGPVERVLEALVWAGWQPFSLPSTRQQGFIDSRGFRNLRLFCLDGSGTILFSTAPGPDFRILRLHWSAESLIPALSCQEVVNMMAGSAPTASPLVDKMPDLLLPGEADFAGRDPGPTGSLSGGSSGYRSTTVLRIAWAPDQLSAHFAGQLQGQGWSLVEDWSGAAVGGSLWRRSAAGLELLGLLTLTQRQPGDYHLDFLLMEADIGRQ